jgi:hypothetical protein
MTLFLLETLPCSKHARVIVAKPKRTEAAKKIEDLTFIPREIVHALSAVDDDTVKAQQTHKMHLAWI